MNLNTKYLTTSMLNCNMPDYGLGNGDGRSHAEIAGHEPRKVMKKCIESDLNPHRTCPDCGSDFVRIIDKDDKDYVEYAVVTLEPYICPSCNDDEHITYDWENESHKMINRELLHSGDPFLE